MDNGRKREFRLWDATTASPHGTPLSLGGDGVNVDLLCASFSPDGRTIITGGINRKVQIWDAGLGRAVGEFLDQDDGSIGNLRLRAKVLAYSADGRILLVGRGDAGGIISIRCYDTTTGRPVGQHVTALPGFDAVALSPYGRTVATSKAGKILLRDADTGSPTGQPIVQPEKIVCLAFRPDGKAILSGSGAKGEQAEVRLWATGTGQPLSPPLWHPGPVTAVAFRPDGRAIVTGCERLDTIEWTGEVRVWDLASDPPAGIVLENRDEDRFVALRHDGGAILVKDGAGSLQLRDVVTYQRLGAALRLAGGDQFLSMSPQANLVLLGREDGAAKVLELATGRLRRVLNRGRYPIRYAQPSALMGG